MEKIKKLLTWLSKYNKAFVPIELGVIWVVLNQFGITKEMSAEQIITILLTSAGVYFVPNKK